MGAAPAKSSGCATQTRISRHRVDCSIISRRLSRTSAGALAVRGLCLSGLFLGLCRNRHEVHPVDRALCPVGSSIPCPDENRPLGYHYISRESFAIITARQPLVARRGLSWPLGAFRGLRLASMSRDWFHALWTVLGHFPPATDPVAPVRWRACSYCKLAGALGARTSPAPGTASLICRMPASARPWCRPSQRRVPRPAIGRSSIVRTMPARSR